MHSRRLSVLEEWRASTSEKRDQDPSLPTKVSSEEHVVLERSAEPTGRRVADEPFEGPSCHPSLWFCGAVVTRALIAKRSVADVLRDSVSRRCGRLFGFTRCVAITGRMSCDKQRVAVRILSAPVVYIAGWNRSRAGRILREGDVAKFWRSWVHVPYSRTTSCRQNKTCHNSFISVSRDTVSIHSFVASVKTRCCGSPSCGPTVDRHSSVNSGARYA